MYIELFGDANQINTVGEQQDLDRPSMSASLRYKREMSLDRNHINSLCFDELEDLAETGAFLLAANRRSMTVGPRLPGQSGITELCDYDVATRPEPGVEFSTDQNWLEIDRDSILDLLPGGYARVDDDPEGY